MNDEHIVSSFDRDLAELNQMVARLGGLAEQQFAAAIDALENRNASSIETIVSNDAELDQLEKDLNDRAIEVIATRAPMATDLRRILSAVKIAAVLERVGDYAKNMAKRTHVLSQMPAIDGAGLALRRMAQAVDSLVQDALDSYIRRDADLAEDVRQRDLEVDQMYNALFREFLTHMMEDPRNITACMHLHFIAKNTERMGDHATSIAEQVIYLVTGQLPDEARPKSSSVPAQAGATSGG